jgi:hypothetical protein
LEQPESGSNHQVYIRSIQNSKNALRIYASFFENIERHGILPALRDPQQLFFSQKMPHLEDFSGHDVDTISRVTGNIFVKTM